MQVPQGVQHRVYPLPHLPAEENEDCVSQLIFISNGIGNQKILDSLKRFFAATPTFNGLPSSAL